MSGALDLVFYAPVGLALTAREHLPALARQGRAQLSQRWTMARAVGQLTVHEAGRQARRTMAEAGVRLWGV
ncbi:MAG: hypothetical protein ACRD0D_11050, partial [Acidimicrobiales bacterium]